MQRRHFLAGGLAAATLPLASAPATAAPLAAGPVLLTLTGAIAHSNREPFDPALDQLMGRQGVRFERAFTFDFGALAALAAHDIAPTLEYDGRPHRLRGPRLADVLALVGAPDAEATRLSLRAIDGYTAQLSLGEVRQAGYIVATHLDGLPLPLGGLGPLWTVFDADKLPASAALPLNERFVRCPWGCYHIDVAPAEPPAQS